MGKTTLCQGLAQKISIRLNSSYKRTKLIQINTATLLSKFYSQSAKHVDEIFTTVEKMCKDDPEQFICVLIDEIESIASSREASMRGEVQDSLRATNSLLTGFDKAKKYPNVIFLCTSNMPSCLDPAFLDRCGLKIELGSPETAVQYEILRDRLQHLIDDGNIVTKQAIPSYRDAMLEFDTCKRLPGSRLLSMVNFLESVNSASDEGKISCRTLNQLPGKAILRYLECDEECDLDMAFEFMEQCILSEEGSRTKKICSNVKTSEQAGSERAEEINFTWKMGKAPQEDWQVDQVFALVEVIGTLFDTIFPGWKALKRRDDKNTHV